MNSHAAIEQLYNQCRDAGSCYVLLDPQAGNPFEEEIAALDEDAAPRVFLRDALFVETPQQAPLLVRLPMSELPLLETMALRAHQEATDVLGGPRSVCAFLQSQLPIEQLAVGLSWALNLKVDSVGGIYFRYFDPRVFHHLGHLVHEATLGHVLKSVDSWSYFQWDGRFVARQSAALSSPRPNQLRLSLKEWALFDTIEHFNATQRLFAKHGLPFEPARTTKLFAEVSAAKALGLPAPDDTAYYVACSHQQAVAPLQHPAWPDVVALLAQDVPLGEALEQLCGITLKPAAVTPPPPISPI